MSDKIRVLFVCHGNICRSPLAEGVFRRLVQDACAAERFEVDSAGISGYHEGEAPDPRTHAEATGRGIILEHSARRMRARDLARFDHVLVMDRENLAGVEALMREAGEVRASVRLLRSFDVEAPPAAEVPDPYYGGPGGFREVHDMVERACRGLLADLTSGGARGGG